MHDRFPGKPKILFVGIPNSSHTHSWIDLLRDSEDFNVRLFSTAPGYPPQDGWVPTYVLSPPHPDHRSDRLIHMYLAVEKKIAGTRRFPLAFFWFSLRAFRRLFNCIGGKLGVPPLGFEIYSADPTDTFQAWQIALARQLPYHFTSQTEVAGYWLAQVIRDWKPDIIHTLGMFDDQGGAFYLDVRKKYQLEGFGRWVCQARGGPDLALYHRMEAKREVIVQILNQCSSFIADNDLNYKFAVELGLEQKKIASLGAVPGTGGIDVAVLAGMASFPVSKRERLILWPKAYECPQSKALPVLEALASAWEVIRPCKIIMTAVTPEVEMWAQTLPQEVHESCELRKRISRTELLELMCRSRVVLMPSLSDGVPNTLYEAMATGAFPIVSPLPTFTGLVQEAQNVLFARNLYPSDIAQALARAMEDDRLVDEAAVRNRSLVTKAADRQQIRPRVIAYYNDLLSSADHQVS